MGFPTLSPAELLLGAFPHAAAIVDRDREVVASNAMFDELLAVRGSGWIAALGERERGDEVTAALERTRDRSHDERTTLRFQDTGTGGFTVHLHRLGQDTSEVLVVVEPIVGRDPLRARLHDLEARVDALRRMKHEISNPLMGLVGHAELLASDPALAPEFRRKARTILDQARRICDHVAAANQSAD
jgi:nitrogen-specific signal transduction histidine kinase